MDLNVLPNYFIGLDVILILFAVNAAFEPRCDEENSEGLILDLKQQQM